MPFVKGKVANPKGRPVGSKNKWTQLREDFLWVYDKIGGKAELANWAKDNRESFYKETTKLLPKQVDVDVQGDITVRWQDGNE